MDEFWVFGYGSLMWNPGFAYVERKAGRIAVLRRELGIHDHELEEIARLLDQPMDSAG